MKSVGTRTRAGALVLLSLVFMAGLPAARARDLSFDDRVAAQKAIEQVYWNHRIWPKENPGPKPPLSAVMPDAAVRERVEDYLRMSALLESYWRQPITADQLQAELSRMTRETKAPGTLRELFAALHDDPILIAECLARPTLAQRRVEAAFAGDTRIHGARRAELASKIAGVESLAAFDRVSGDHSEITYALDAHDAARRRLDLDPADRAIHLTRTEWNREIARLAEGLGAKTLGGSSALPVGRVSRIVDRGDRFVAFAVRAKNATSVTVASVSTPKRSFGDWARETTIAPTLDARALVPAQKGYQLPAFPLTECTDDTWAATDPGQNVPSARSFHTAVWTGSEMIVWGGSAGTAYFNSGGRYDPATDSWATASLSSGTGENVPDVRTYHVAVWTGSEVIIWGGFNGAYLNTGGRYNPATDTWAASSLTYGSGANTPDARRFPTAVWTGSEMIVWGGYNGAYLNTGGRYDPATDTWAASSLTTGAGSNVPSGRRFATAVWTGTEMIVWGGDDFSAEVVFNTGGRYDPVTDSWAESSLTTGSGANAPGPQYLHTAVWTGTEMIVWGGLDSTYNNINTGGRYNPSTDSWAASSLTTASGPNVPSGRNFHTAIWTGAEMVVWGGNDANSDDLQTGGRYSPSTDSWSASSLNAGTGANTPTPRSGHTAVWTGTEMIVWGGEKFLPAEVDFNTGGRYDPATDSWVATESGSGPPEARFGHTALWTGAELIVWGGAGSLDTFNNGGRYDPATNSWAVTSLNQRTGANVPDGRLDHTAVWTGSEMIVWGGYADGELNTGGRYNPAADSWSESSLTSGAGASVPAARYWHTAVWTGSEMIVWGGVDSTASLSTGGRFNPSTDSWTASSLSTGSGSNAPDGRFLHTAVWTGTEMIVWGGYNYEEFFDWNNGGRYNPSTDSWAASSLTTGSGPNVPAARDSHTAVWTGSEMIVWAGFGDVEIFNTGGRYNPSTDSWADSSLTTGSGPNVPSPRYGHTAVWTGSEMIAWGGEFLNFDNVADYFGNGGRYNVTTDTWAASSLTQGSGSNVPDARAWHTAAWIGSEMIIWGGYDGEIALNSGGRFCASAVGGCATDEQCDDGNACTIDACTDGVCGCPGSSGACTGTHRTYVSTDVPKVISAEGTPTVTSSLTVSGAGPYLSDVNVRTFIAHASSGQIQITLQSPAGTIVTLSSNNGGANDAFYATRWDDDADPGNPAPYASPSSYSSLVTDTEYPNLAVQPTFAPEEALGAFMGENPNGVWTLTVADQTNLDGGNVANWSIDLSTLATPPAAVTLSYASSDVPKTISSSGTPTVVSTVAVSGPGTQIGQVRLQTFIQHTFSSDLDVTITSPSGTSVTLTTDNGGTFDNVFNGTLWDDDGDPGNAAPYVVPSAASKLATDTQYTNFVAKTTLTAEEALSAFVGEDPSGVWTLTISDDANGDGGTLAAWSLELTTNTCGTASCALDCDDGNACTVDSCDPSTGCVHVNNAAQCDDANPCTDDSCIPGTGECAHESHSGPCDDGNACTAGDVCVTPSSCDGSCTSVCEGGPPVSCDDGNACTDDTCDPVTGCHHADNSAPCDDGNPCTVNDTCHAGVCGSDVVPANFLGANGTICDDGNPCTTGDVCLDGVCVGEGADCVVEFDPENNATNVPVSTNVTLTYHDPIDPATVTSSTFRLRTPGSENSVPATLTVSSSGTRATLDPTSALSPDTTYRVEASGIDGPGEESTQPFTSFFRTGAVNATTAIATVSEATDPLPALAKGGSAVAAAGDLNNDGLDDFISGAPGYADAAHGVPVEAGAALVYLGSAGSTERAGPDIVFTGIDAHDRAGVSVAGDFDFNGDGRRDILIGAEQVDRATTPDSPAATGKGKAYLIFFDPDNCTMNPRRCDPAASNQVSLSLVGRPGGIPGVVFEGEALGDQAGFSVAGGGTSTPSAATDVIIGAPGADPLGVTDAGAAYIVFDNPGLSGDVSLTSITSVPQQVPGKAYYGSEPGEHVGFSTAFAGPLVSGQSADLGTVLIGAPDARSRVGRIIAPPGDPDTTPIIVDAVGRTEPGMTNRPGFQIVGTQPGEQLGWDVADGGDAMEDGVSDLLIGAPTYDVTTPGAGLAILTDAGRVLQTSRTFVSGVYNADAVGTSIGGAIWQGAAMRDQLGFAVAGAGDVTGDGYADIVLGAPFVDPIVGGAIRSDAGAVYVINGSPASGPLGLRSVADVGTTIAGRRLTGTEAGEHAGSSIAGTGDVNGDGRNDFVVGAPDRNNQAGTVYMVLLATGAPVGSCGPQGCVVADLPTGAEVDVPAGGLTATIDITVAGLLDSSSLPAPVPAGKVLLGAARFTPNGQPVLSPFATIYIPTTQPLLGSRPTGAAIPLFYFNGTGWVNAGIIGTGVTNPSYPSRSAVRATADVLRTYAVFLDDCATLNCDDGNPCTDDGCRTATGCFHTNNTAPCDDGNLCTTGDTCSAGICTPSFNGLNHPAPKSSAYYRQLCERRDRNQLPWHGDQLTVADAVCVGQLTATFSGIATINDLCGILNSDNRPPHGGRHHGGSGNGPDGKICDKAENELVATAINICRARVCEEQNLDSHCHGNDNTTVSQSFAEADAILDDALRTKDTCKDASCELKEINNGHALELNSLTLTTENTSVRLRWTPPELDDGAGSPDAYEVWRRPLGSGAAFIKLGRTTGLSFLDQTSGTVRWEYQVSVVVP